MVNTTTTEATAMISTATTTTASTSQGGAAVAGALTRMRFPEPSAYWSMPGDQPNFRTWWTMPDNYLYWLERHASPADPITDKDKNRLVYSLLGPEGTSRFASNPMASRIRVRAHLLSSQKRSKRSSNPQLTPFVHTLIFCTDTSKRVRVQRSFWAFCGHY